MPRDDTDGGDVCRKTAKSDGQSCRWSLGSHASNPGTTNFLYLTLRGLTVEPITPWGRGLSGLLHDKAHPCLFCQVSHPIEGIDTRFVN